MWAETTLDCPLRRLEEDEDGGARNSDMRDAVSFPVVRLAVVEGNRNKRSHQDSLPLLE